MVEIFRSFPVLFPGNLVIISGLWNFIKFQNYGILQINPTSIHRLSIMCSVVGVASEVTV